MSTAEALQRQAEFIAELRARVGEAGVNPDPTEGPLPVGPSRCSWCGSYRNEPHRLDCCAVTPDSAPLQAAHTEEEKVGPDVAPCSQCGSTDWEYNWGLDWYHCGRCNRRVLGEDMMTTNARSDERGEGMTSPATEEQQEVRVTVEDGRAIYVRGEAIDVLRGEANRQADMHLRAAVEVWDECDVTDLDQLKDVRFKLGMAQDAISALVGLAPIPDEEP